MEEKKLSEYEKWERGYEKRKKWGIGIGIFLFIFGILLIILGSPAKVEFAGSICSIGGIFLAIAWILTDESGKSTRVAISKGFERMDRHFERMDRHFDEALGTLKMLPSEIGKEIRK